jgi:membrane protease subunit HflK
VRVERVEIVGLKPPDPVAAAFDEVTRAEQESGAKILESREYASRQHYESEGQASRLVSEAESRKKRFVEKASADASYFLKILPEYRQRPAIVTDTLRQDAVRRALAGVKDKYFLYNSPAGRRELRLWLGPEKTRPGEKKPAGEKIP